jgi:chorismate mutase
MIAVLRQGISNIGRILVVAASACSLATPARAESPVPLHDLIDAAAERLQIADPVAANKWLTGGSINDPARVQQVLDGVRADAESHGISVVFVQQVFTDQINATEGIEYERFAEWKFDASSAPGSAPDLAASRSRIDGLNHEMVSQIALQWPILHSPTCASEVATAVSDVSDARAFDALYRRALGVATRSYCTG